MGSCVTAWKCTDMSMARRMEIKSTFLMDLRLPHMMATIFHRRIRAPNGFSNWLAAPSLSIAQQSSPCRHDLGNKNCRQLREAYNTTQHWKLQVPCMQGAASQRSASLIKDHDQGPSSIGNQTRAQTAQLVVLPVQLPQLLLPSDTPD